ncbi:30S ribosomal protein S4 [Candidatus Giovannonibacteria bacterium]|nr:30S ribosomal protein S4 [Candidatus Giovannonibacteria bacterium]
MRSATTCKTCRRLGVSVCGREKCAIKRKPYPPGVHGRSFRRGVSEFGSQLREKQKVKFSYGLRERQFRNYVEAATSQKNMAAGDALLELLELRLDNVVYRLGLAPTRGAARQMVGHGHIIVNGKRVTIPSLRLKVGDELEVRQNSKTGGLFSDLGIKIKKITTPAWLTLDKENFKAKVSSRPEVMELGKNYNITSIIEYYSR